MSGAATAESEARLRDGSLAVIRPIAPDDKELLRAGFERLSPDSRYRRFLTPVTRLSEHDLAYLTEVDHHDHEALVAIDRDSSEGLGVARFVRDPDNPDTAEAAVTVIDDRQGRGWARRFWTLWRSAPAKRTFAASHASCWQRTAR